MIAGNRAGDGLIRSGDVVAQTEQESWCHLILWIILRYKNITLSTLFKLNSKEKSISKPVINAETSPEWFMLVRNEAENYQKLEDSIVSMINRKGDIKKDKLIEHGKRMGINETIRQI